VFPYDEIIAQFAKCIQKDDNGSTVRMAIGTVQAESPLTVRADGLELDEADCT